MKKKVVVLSLGGSLIVPEDVDVKFLQQFKKTILGLTKKYKFVVVCGGGSVARKYISALKKVGANETLQSFSGISATRMNARFMNYFFNQDAKYGIPHTEDTLKEYLKKENVVFCGALEYKPNQTSDSTAANLAKNFETFFVNITNVKGLYNKNPKKHKDAKFISKISWKEFNDMATKMKYEPGQHFVLDQKASIVIMKNKIPTYIVGKSAKELGKILQGKKFVGTLVEG